MIYEVIAGRGRTRNKQTTEKEELLQTTEMMKTLCLYFSPNLATTVLLF